MGGQLRLKNYRVSTLEAVYFDLFVSNFLKISFFPIYWFKLLQILQKYGEIEHFNFVYHTNGPNIGQPKGFAFIKYKEVRSESLKLES